MKKKAILLTLVKLAWENPSTVKVNNIVVYGEGSYFAAMPVVLGTGPLTLHGAN